MAVALFVIALLLGSLMVPLTTQVESRNYGETQRILAQAREALIGYAAANGRFPCPASANSNGAEHFASFPAPTGSATDGRCNALVTGTGSILFHGFLPAATLGFTPVDANGNALDAWGLSPQNRIRYAVSNVTVNTIIQPFTKTNGMRNAGMYNTSRCTQTDGTAAVCTLPGSVTAAQGLIFVCSSGTGVVAGTNCGTAVKLTDNAIAVIWSTGANAATGGASVDEQQNPNQNGGTGDRIFVSRFKSGGTSGDFDDLVTWIAPATLFNRLIAAGQLP